MASVCPCGSGQDYQQCCGRYIEQGKLPDTAEQLMRSRYSAYVLGNTTYLIATWVPEQCPTELVLDSTIHWLDLTIRSVVAWPFSDTEGQVEFSARFIDADKLVILHENSHFVRVDGRWLYHSGEMVPAPVESIGRNQTCPCGSGRKFKRCCSTAKRSV